MKLIHLQTNSFAKIAKHKEPNFRLPAFSHFPLHESIVKFLQERDFHTPTYIQYALMTRIFNEDPNHAYQGPLHIISPTGSGKTLSYTLPIADSLKKEESDAEATLTRSERPRSLILTTTKELVLQGKNVCKDVSHFAKLRCDGIGIGKSLAEEKLKLKEGLDVLVAGYPRFKRMLNRREAYLSGLSWIVVDEMDTLFESQKSIVNDLFDTIIMPKLQQDNPPKLILSSTTNPPALKEFLLKKIPNLFQIVDKNTHINLENIKHEFLYCQEYDKHQTLMEEIKRHKKEKLMIFCNTVASLHELEYYLNDGGIPVVTLHSQLSKPARIKNYEYFRDLDKGIMLSTDLGARGLHFPNLKRIINYDFPISTCDYLQRAGRTGRAGEKGSVVSLYFKKHLEIINELKDASFSTPLKIGNSAYGLKNREETKQPNKFHKK